MNRIRLLITFSMLILGSQNSIISCPTCIGRLEDNTPPLFTKEYDDAFWPQENGSHHEEKKADAKTVITPKKS